jgi:hypothetical protein
VDQYFTYFLSANASSFPVIGGINTELFGFYHGARARPRFFASLGSCKLSGFCGDTSIKVIIILPAFEEGGLLWKWMDLEPFFAF